VTAITGIGSFGAVIAALVSLLPGLTPVRHRHPVRPHVVKARSAPAPAVHDGPFAVGIRALKFVDRSRTVRYPGQKPQPRTLITVIRYPALGPASDVDRRGARPARDEGPFPLVIFGHGFAVTPGPYAQLLQAWARAGYVVAAPIFPLGNANAPGGPNESDIVNQPRDMSFVISHMLTLSKGRRGIFAGLISPKEIAVAGQSDGGVTALAVAYDRFYIDRRVRAAVILSGAELPGGGAFTFPAPSPPLLASQGTADTTNRPANTYTFFNAAPRPKFLLKLLGAPHLPPYTTEQPQLGIVERATIAFLDRYLKHLPRTLARIVAAGNVGGLASLEADP
jgi:dienelactone hydrolase